MNLGFQIQCFYCSGVTMNIYEEPPSATPRAPYPVPQPPPLVTTIHTPTTTTKPTTLTAVFHEYLLGNSEHFWKRADGRSQNQKRIFKKCFKTH